MSNLLVESGIQINSGDGSYFNVGDIIAWHRSDSVPDGWLLCDGQQVAISSYPDLHAKIGTSYYGGTQGVINSGLTPGNFWIPRLNWDNMAPAYDKDLTTSGTIFPTYAHSHTGTGSSYQSGNWSGDGVGTAEGHSHTANYNTSGTDYLNHSHNAAAVYSTNASNFGNYQVTSTGAVSPEAHTHNAGVTMNANRNNAAWGHTHNNNATNTNNILAPAKQESHYHTAASISISSSEETFTPPIITTRFIIKV